MWNVKVHKETFTSPTVAAKFMRNLIADNIREAMVCIEVPTEIYEKDEMNKVFRTGFILLFYDRKEFHVIGDVFRVKMQDGFHDEERYINEDSFREVTREHDEARLYFFVIRTLLNIFAIPMTHIVTFLDTAYLSCFPPIPSEKYRDEEFMKSLLVENAEDGVETLLMIGELSVPAEEEPSPAPWEGD